MTLEESIKKTINQREETLLKDELVNIESVCDLFDKMVADGLISRPQYNLAPISTLPINVVNRTIY